MNGKEEEGCVAALIWMVWFTPGVLLSGWVTMLLWGWFITPLGAPTIGLWHAVGLNIIVGFMHTTTNNNSDDPIETILTQIGTRILMAAIALGVGWVVLQLMGA